MSFVTGPRHGRSRAVYPQSPGAGGALAAIVPLSRQRFIDGDTTQTGLNGAVSGPFRTIAQFTASRTNVSIADATANYVGWVMPSLAGYVENVTLPPYVSTELRADSLSLIGGTVITGNVTWANAAGPFAATLAIATLHNITVSGTFTVTDDVGAPPQAVVFGGDEFGQASVLLGAFDSSACTKTIVVSFLNTQVNGIVNTGGVDGTVTGFYDCNIAGAVASTTVQAFGTTFGANITTGASGDALFFDCRFTSGPVLNAAGGALFDGTSWQNFVTNGGTRSAGTAVVVIGGYNGAAVEGAALPTDAVITDVSINGSGASAGYTGSDSGNHYSSSGLDTGDAGVKLLTGGASQDDTMLITKTDLAAHALEVQNSVGAVIGEIPSGSRGFVLARFNVSEWVFAAGGSLAA